MAVRRVLSSNLLMFSISGFKTSGIMTRQQMKPILSATARSIYNTRTLLKDDEEKQVVEQGTFEKINDKSKNTYLDMIYIFINRDQVYRRGHVEFIYAALKNMEEFGVHRDLEVYRSLIDVLPKGKFVAQNMMQAEFMHYPKQQQCIIDLLQQMEDNGVMPDAEMEEQLLNIFGKRAYPLRKYWRMMYWMPKFMHLNPVPRDLPNDVMALARMAVARMSEADPQTKISEYQTKDIEDSIDDTWIVSAQSPTQEYLLEKHNPKEPVYVEGAFKVWLREKQVNYFMLRANPKPPPKETYDEDDVTDIKVSLFNIMPPIHKHIAERNTVHEQEDGTILALCATGSSSKDSLLSWIRHLEKNGNPALSTVPVIFTLRSAPKEIVVTEPPKSNEVSLKQ